MAVRRGLPKSESFTRQLLTALLAHHVLGVPVGPVGIGPADALRVLAVGPEPTNVALANSFIVINAGGGPTDDKPTVTLETPRDPDRVSSSARWANGPASDGARNLQSTRSVRSTRRHAQLRRSRGDGCH
ncbi:MAG TPA: hypothetical protein VEJ84_09905 [Acidimicrobiales bacterium]|nr:hypothetical protein [Acidimicrobiales bacterium]